MSESTRESIYQAIASIRLIDPHTHINPHNPASQTLADILGYHYYTELVHSAGMPKARIEEEGISPRELVSRLVEGLPNIENTANYQWLINICKTFFDFQDDRITASNWESLYDAAEQKMASADWPQTVLDQSNVEAVFLTNDFDDKLEGFDTNTYIPCLRTDDLVFHLGKPETRERLEACSGIALDGSLQNLRDSLRQRFEYFVPRGARACAISIPPDFQPAMVKDGRAQTALDYVLRLGSRADVSHHVALSRCVFWTLAELCDEFAIPFDLMIGVNRQVYPDGVYQGQDLYDSRVSLIQYKELFNAFPDVKFPISVLASVTNQELVSYSWIFPNVVTNGHWWYSNTPSFIHRDATARLEAVPRNKQIGYYSDAYKLEFVWPKFDMYRQILSDILTEHFVGKCGWSEERAVELGYQILRGNVDTIFPNPVETDDVEEFDDADVLDDTIELNESDIAGASMLGAGAALAAGAIAVGQVSSDESESEDAHETGSVDEIQEWPTQEIPYQEPEEQLADRHQNETPGPESQLNDFQTQDTWVDHTPIEQQEQPSLTESDQDSLVSEINELADEVDSDEMPTVFDNHDTVRMDDPDDADATTIQNLEAEPAADLTADAQPAFEVPTFSPEQVAGVYMQSDFNSLYTQQPNDQPQEPVEEPQDEEDPTLMETIDLSNAAEEQNQDELDLDPSPNHDEIQSADVADVEIRDTSVEALHDATSIESEIESDPLDVGDLTDDASGSVRVESEIQPLQGDSGFIPDTESFQLETNPINGEFVMPEPPEPNIQDSGTDDVIGQLEAMIQESMELNEDDETDPQ